MERLYTGPTGSGKTTILFDQYMRLGQKATTDHCLVFVKNATSVTDWRNRISLQSIGPLNIFTYFGFVQRELTRFWSLVEEKLLADLIDPENPAFSNAMPTLLPFGNAGIFQKTVEPAYMTVETAHFLMSRLVRDARVKDGAFATLNATSEQIAVQLIDNLNHAALNGLTFDEVRKRLRISAGQDADKQAAYQDALRVMARFRDQCFKYRCLDYSLIVELYNRYLLPDAGYFATLTKTYHYLIVDDLEKTVARAQELILKLMQSVQETHLGYNPEGGFTAFFGASPRLAEKTFFPLCEVQELTHSFTASKEARALAKALATKVKEGQPLPKTTFIKRELQTDLRGDMLIEVGKAVQELIDAGVEPGKIGIVAPGVDKVLEFTLAKYFEGIGCTLVNLTRTKRLLDEPYAQALVTLAFLVNPTWKLELNFSSLVQTLSLILKLDPVRSALLAEEIFKNQLNLPDLDDVGMRPRLGFDNSDKYDHFREWVREKQTVDVEMEHFFQVVFSELLAPLGPDEKDILACRQIINSITRFKEIMTRIKPMDERQLGEDFIDMVLKGTLAADVLFRPPSSNAQVIVATPYRFLFSPYVKEVEYLFLLDVGSENWFQSTAKELSNTYILSRQWNEEEEWTDELDQSLRKEQLTNYLQSLLGKCSKGIYLANSYYNSQGWEQEGLLLEWLQTDEPRAVDLALPELQEQSDQVGQPATPDMSILDEFFGEKGLFAEKPAKAAGDNGGEGS